MTINSCLKSRLPLPHNHNCQYRIAVGDPQSTKMSNATNPTTSLFRRLAWQSTIPLEIRLTDEGSGSSDVYYVRPLSPLLGQWCSADDIRCRCLDILTCHCSYLRSRRTWWRWSSMIKLGQRRMRRSGGSRKISKARTWVERELSQVRDHASGESIEHDLCDRGTPYCSKDRMIMNRPMHELMQ